MSDNHLRVLAWPADANRTGNPYNAQLAAGLRRLGVRVDEFSARRLLRGKYDIWHVHWPDGALGRGSAVRAAAGATALVGLAALARARGTRIVWTVHNLKAHRPIRPSIERAFWQRWARQVDATIHLSESARLAAMTVFPPLRRRPAFVIAHQHYRDAYPPAPSREVARERLGQPTDARVITHVGYIRPYKAVPELIRAFRGVADPAARLLIAGRPEMPALARQIREAAGRDPRIVLRLERVAASEMSDLVGAADLVALTYAEVLNSGAALLALSLDRPVLVPDYGAMSDLRGAVGPEWVHLLSGAITPAALADALAEAAENPPPAPAPLDAFAPAAVAEATLEAYRDVLSPSGRG
jgi:glycosyltransferase involved in cell wall biosynthesis